MRILYVLHSTGVTEGSSKAFVSLMETLQKQEVEPIVALPNKKGLYSILKDKGIYVLVAPICYNTYPIYRGFKSAIAYVPRMIMWPLCNIYAALKIALLLRKNKPDLVHTNTSVVNVGYYVAKMWGVPHIFHIREYAVELKMYFFPYKTLQVARFNSKHNYTICITHGIQQYYNLQKNNKSRVVYDGVCQHISYEERKLVKPYFLYAGRLHPSKGALDLVKAYAKYASELAISLPLYLAGSCSRPGYKVEIEKVISQNGLVDKVLFLGERKDIYRLMQQAKAIVIPSINEGFGFCMAEAMFNSCLVIGYNKAGTKEQFDNGLELVGQEIGLRYNDEKQLIKHLIDVTKASDNAYDDMKLKANEVVNSLYTYEKSALEVLRFYGDILKEKV